MGNSKSKAKRKDTDGYDFVLLGTGQSGKTTIRHQLRKIYEYPKQSKYRFDGWDSEEYAVHIRCNTMKMVNVIMSELVKANEEGDKDCDITFLGLSFNFNDEEKNIDHNILKSAYDKKNLPGMIVRLLSDSKALLSDSKALLMNKSLKTQFEIKEKLRNIIENRVPKVVETMKLSYSDAFDLNNISNCVELLLMFSKENLSRYDVMYKIEVDEWDAVLTNTKIDMNTASMQEIYKYTDTIFNMIENNCTDRCLDNLKLYGQALNNVWKELKQFRHVYFNIGDKYKRQMIDNIDYYFNKCLEIFDKDFIPNDEDLIRMYNQTCGMMGYKSLKVNEQLLRIRDTSGQPHKWRIYVKNCSAIIYVSSLDDFRRCIGVNYCNYNAMEKSINYFQQVLKHKLKTILILTKEDLFKKSLKQGHIFGDEFKYKGMKYDKTYDLNVINVLIKNSLNRDNIKIPMEVVKIIYKYLNFELSLKFAYDDGIKFVQQKFLSVAINNNYDKKIQIFVVNSLISDQIQNVMQQIRDV